MLEYFRGLCMSHRRKAWWSILENSKELVGVFFKLLIQVNITYTALFLTSFLTQEDIEEKRHWGEKILNGRKGNGQILSHCMYLRL